MHYILYTLFGLGLTWLAFLAYLWVAGKAVQGRDVSAMKHLPRQLHGHTGKALLYCYSPNCGPCRNMSPVVDQLREEGRTVLKVDITQQTELARELEIRAAPTLLLIHNGIIEKVLLGSRSREQIEALLNG